MDEMGEEERLTLVWVDGKFKVEDVGRVREDGLDVRRKVELRDVYSKGPMHNRPNKPDASKPSRTQHKHMSDRQQLKLESKRPADASFLGPSRRPRTKGIKQESKRANVPF
jgi:hypothetical protein